MRRPSSVRAPSKPEDQAVRVVEHVGQFHAQSGKLVDIEKAAVVDVVRGHAIMGGAPKLVLDQGHADRRQLCAIAGRAVETADGGVRCASLTSALSPAARASTAFRSAAPRATWGRHSARLGESVADALQFRVPVAQNARVVQRTDGQLVRIVSPNRERSRLFASNFKRRLPRHSSSRRIGPAGTAPGACSPGTRGRHSNRYRTSRRAPTPAPTPGRRAKAGLSAPPTPIWLGTKSRICRKPLASKRRDHALEGGLDRPVPGSAHRDPRCHSRACFPCGL